MLLRQLDLETMFGFTTQSLFSLVITYTQSRILQISYAPYYPQRFTGLCAAVIMLCFSMFICRVKSQALNQNKKEYCTNVTMLPAIGYMND